MSGAACIALLCALGGCGKSGPNLTPVTRRVTLGGRPLEEVEVLFQPDGAASPSIGRTDKAGNYRLRYKRGVEGGTVGRNTVRLKTITEMTRGKQQIPEQYTTGSELKREVMAGENRFDFEVKELGN